MDDWREETQLRLNNSSIYKSLKAKCAQDASGNQVLDLIDIATHYAYQKTKVIIRHMGQFTLHDSEHLFRVLHLMGKLFPTGSIDKLTVPELMLLILSAFFHDIGMAPEESDIISWRKVWDVSPSFENDIDEKAYKEFLRFTNAKPEDISLIDEYIKLGNNSNAELLKAYLISEYIRITHTNRARLTIQKDWSGKIKYRDTDLTVELASICFSHNEDTLSLLEMDYDYLCGPDIYACLPLIGVILRLSDILDFDAKRTPSILYSHLLVRNPVSINEWNKHRAIEAWTINEKIIQYHAKCNHPAIEASIHSFCDQIDNELSSCNNILRSINEYNRGKGRELTIRVPYKVDRTKIETQKNIFGNPIYIYRETQFNLSKNQVIDLLMGTKLYGDPEVALRELLQNSIDACLLRQALEDSWGDGGVRYIPEIHITYTTGPDGDILEVNDNGTGMDQSIIDSYYTKIGSSFYKSSEFYDLKSQTNTIFTPTSRFGIGILSCFMVSDNMVVDTRRIYGPHESSDSLNLTIEGQESIFLIKSGKRKIPGTSTKLYLRRQKHPWERMNDGQFIKSVENVVPNPPFKIMISTQTCTKSIDEHSFMQISAESLKNHSWDKQNNIREFFIEFSDPDKGFVGSIIVAVLEQHGFPVMKIEVTSKNVTINDKQYELKKSICYGDNEICLNSTSIEIDDDANIDSSTSMSTLTGSESRLSLHGIEVPTTLFPQRWRMSNNQVKIDWPIPVLIIVDVCGKRDLDLNTSRNQVLLSEKWTDLESELAYEICLSIYTTVTDEYWSILYKLLHELTKNSIFIDSLDRVHNQKFQSGSNIDLNSSGRIKLE